MDDKTENLMQNDSPVGQAVDAKLTMGKLFFLVILTGLLCTMGPLSIFAPVPLTMGMLLYGRSKTAFAVVSTLVLLFVLQSMQQIPGAILAVFAVSYIYSLLLGEIIFRGLRPIYGLVFAGTIIIVLTVLSLVLFELTSDVGIKEFVGQYVAEFLANLKESSKEKLQVGGEEARVIHELVNNPQDIAKNILNWAPTVIVMSTFLGLWASLFMILRNGIIWKQRLEYRYELRDLVNFKTPDWLVYPLILALVLFVGGDKYIGGSSEVIGGNLLYILGIFYFFQGFGIFSDLLTYMGIFGIMRSILMIFTLFSAWRILAVVGIFDLWLNFRRFFKRNKDNEGDNV